MANLGADIRNSKLIASYKSLVNSINRLNKLYVESLKKYAFEEDKSSFFNNIDVLIEQTKVINEDIEILKNTLTILKGKAQID